MQVQALATALPHVPPMTITAAVETLQSVLNEWKVKAPQRNINHKNKITEILVRLKDKSLKKMQRKLEYLKIGSPSRELELHIKKF